MTGCHGSRHPGVMTVEGRGRERGIGVNIYHYNSGRVNLLFGYAKHDFRQREHN